MKQTTEYKLEDYRLGHGLTLDALADKLGFEGEGRRWRASRYCQRLNAPDLQLADIILKLVPGMTLADLRPLRRRPAKPKPGKARQKAKGTAARS